MRIAIAGISGECSTFTLDVMRESIFEVLRGEELLAHYDWPGRLGDAVADVEWHPTTRAATGAGGPIDPEFYDMIEAEVLAGLQQGLEQGPYDGVYLDMHGALNVLGRTRLEERFVGRIRALVGPEPVISLSMDPHGNFSEELAHYVDLAACYRHAPHIDRLETRDRAVTNLVATIRRGAKPAKAWVRVPVLLPGERTSTLFEPATRIFGALDGTITQYGIQDVNLWCGFPWADEDRNAAAVFATGDDERAIVAAVEQVAGQYWDAREDFGITSPNSGTWADALDFVLAKDADDTAATTPAEWVNARPVYLSDAGDNVTAGGSGDVTVAMQATIQDTRIAAAGVQVLFAGIVDVPTLEAAIEAGVGATLERGIGAVVDARYAPPVDGHWVIEQFVEGVYDEGVVGVVLRGTDVGVNDTISVSVQRFRQRFVGGLDPATPAFAMIGLAFVDITPYDVVVVKNGYLFPNQRAMSGSEFLAFTPGGTDLDFDRLRFDRLWRPMFPMDRDFDADLTAKILPRTSEPTAAPAGTPATNATPATPA